MQVSAKTPKKRTRRGLGKILALKRRERNIVTDSDTDGSDVPFRKRAAAAKPEVSQQGEYPGSSHVSPAKYSQREEQRKRLRDAESSRETRDTYNKADSETEELRHRTTRQPPGGDKRAVWSKSSKLTSDSDGDSDNLHLKATATRKRKPDSEEEDFRENKMGDLASTTCLKSCEESDSDNKEELHPGNAPKNSTGRNSRKTQSVASVLNSPRLSLNVTLANCDLKRWVNDCKQLEKQRCRSLVAKSGSMGSASDDLDRTLLEELTQKGLHDPVSIVQAIT